MVTVDKTDKSFKKIKEILFDLQLPVKEHFNAEIIGLFGSYSRGEEKEGSDVDILVKFYEGASLFDYVALADFLEEKLNLKVDILSERAIRKELKEHILEEVVPI